MAVLCGCWVLQAERQAIRVRADCSRSSGGRRLDWSFDLFRESWPGIFCVGMRRWIWHLVGHSNMGGVGDLAAVARVWEAGGSAG